MPEAARSEHFYGGQALIEGVMMRGRDHWAVAVRRPDESIYRESHEIDSVVNRRPIWGKPGLRGMIVLGQSLAIGWRAMQVAIMRSQPDEEQLSKGGQTATVVFAVILFMSIFVAGPALLFGWMERAFLGSSILANILEGLFRFALLIAYVAGIGMLADVKRLYQYHGAEHQTITAYEHDDVLDQEHVSKYSTVHKRCGTNFLGIVFLVAILVFSVFPPMDLGLRVVSRLVAAPLIAAVAYELLRLGARFPKSLVMRALTAPGMWMQRITTRPSDPDQREVAIASFEEVLRCEREHTTTPPPPDGAAASAPEEPLSAEGLSGTQAPPSPDQPTSPGSEVR